MISAIAFPSLDKSLDRLALSGSAATLSAELRAARADAIRHARTVEISALAAEGGDSGYRRGTRPPALLPQDVRLKLPGDKPIGFYPDGSSTGGCVQLMYGNRSVIIGLDPETGQQIEAPR